MTNSADEHFTLLGPAVDAESARDSDAALWQLNVQTVRGAPNHTPRTPVVEENLAIRVLLQTASTQSLRPSGQWETNDDKTVNFRRPVVLAMLMRQYRPGKPDAFLGKIKFTLGDESDSYKVAEAANVPELADLAAQPIGKWSAGTQSPAPFAIPPLRLVNGFVPLRLKPERKPGALGLTESPNGTHWQLFCAFDCPKPSVDPKDGPQIELVPNGFEFAARAPSSLRTLANASDNPLVRLQAGVRRIGGKQEVVIALVGGPAAFLDAVEAGIKQLFYRLRSDTVVHVDFDTRPSVPLLWWQAKLDDGVFSVADDTLHLDPSCLRVRLVTDPPVDGGGPCVAQASVGRAVLTIGRSGSSSLTLATPDEHPHSEPSIELVPGTAENEGKVLTRLSKPLKIGIDRDSMAESLTERYRAQGVMPPRAAVAPYAYVPLAAGWVQLPLGDCEIEFKPPALPRAQPESILTGTLSLRMADLTRGKLEIDAASWFQIVATWSPGQALAEAKIEIADAGGVARDVMFIADGSPRPEEGLPSLDAGPIATREVPLRFGLRSDQEPCGALQGKRLELKWKHRDWKPGDTKRKTHADAASGIVWMGHATLPLIAATPMTRTTASGEPLRSRGLLPHVWQIETGLTFALDSEGALPTIGDFTPVPPGMLWHWPWPDRASFTELPAVPLVLPTLPGIEVTPTNPTSVFKGASGLHVRLRHDLPALDEYFASVPTPKSENAIDAAETEKPAASATLAPTTLDPLRLIPFWRLQADRLSLARAQAVNAIPWCEFPRENGKAPVPVTVPVSGLFEPYAWSTPFVFNEIYQDATRPALAIGHYRLGSVDYAGSLALKGIGGKFGTDGVPNDDAGPLEIVGNAARVLLEAGLAADSRGLSTSIRLDPRDAIRGAVTLHLRASVFDETPDDDDTRRQLGTLSAPVDVSLEGIELRFWCRDLPLAAAGESLVFRGDTSPPEHQIGPDASAFDREAAQSSLHEWRFFAPGRPRYEIEIGPFAFKPLRLWGAKFGRPANGKGKVTVESIEVIGSLSLAGEPRPLVGNESFSAEDAYASGNLVLLTIPGGGSKSFPRFKRVQIERRDHRSKIIVVPDESIPPALQFVIDAAVDPVPATQSAEKQAVVLSLVLANEEGDDGHPLRFQSCSLQLTLLGALCSPQRKELSVLNEARKLCLTFAAEPAPSVVRITRVVFDYTSDRVATVTSRIEVSVEATAADASESNGVTLPIVRWNSDARVLKWLGLRAPCSSRIDHARGTLRLFFPTADEGLAGADHHEEDAPPPQLFGGLEVDPANLDMQVLLAVKPVIPAPRGPLAGWPVVFSSAGYCELRAECPHLGTARQVLTASPPEETGAVTWTSLFVLDLLQRERTSRIGWPLNSLALVESPPTGAAIQFTSRASEHVFAHTTELEAYSLSVGLALLRARGDDYELVRPLRGLVRARHVIEGTLVADVGDTRPFSAQWATLEHVELRDFRDMVRSAGAETVKAAKAEEMAFAPRYREGMYRGMQGKDYLIHAGIATRAFAAAGIPDFATASLLDEWFTAHLFSKGIDRTQLDEEGLERNLPPSCLLVFGGSLTLCEWPERRTDERPGGVRWTLPWFSPIGAATSEFAESPLGELRQAPKPSEPDEHYRAADFDAASGRRIEWEFAGPLAFDATGTQTTIARNLLTLRRLQLGSNRTTEAAALADATAVEQPLVERLNAQKSAVPFDKDSLRRAPLFLRTLLALRTLARLSPLAKSPSAAAFSTLLAVGADSDESASTVIRISLSPIQPQETTAAAPHSLIVIGRDGVAVDALPADTSLASEQLGTARVRAAAVARIREPLMILLAQRERPREADDKLIWHTGAFVAISPTARRAAYSTARRPLSDLTDTLFASSALGWPEGTDFVEGAGWAFANVVDAALELAPQPTTGPHTAVLDAPYQNESQGLALRAATFVAPTAATSALPASPSRDSRRAILWTHRQVVFDRAAAAGGSVAPPARHLSPGRARLRVPTTQQTYDALGRVSGVPDDVTRFQSILPGAFERAVIGARPGVFYVEVDSTLIATGNRTLDEKFPRFGQPATAAPLQMRQQRYPRSPELPRKDDAALTRRTMVSWSEKRTFPRRSGETIESWTPLCAVKGPATLFRVGDAKHSILLRVCEVSSAPSTAASTAARPVLALSETTLGVLLLEVTAPGFKPEGAAPGRAQKPPMLKLLVQEGLLRPGVTRAWLVCGDRTFYFGKLKHYAGPDDSTYYVKLFSPEDRKDTALFALRALAQHVSADRPLELRIGLGTVVDDDPSVDEEFDLAKPPVTEDEQPPAPPLAPDEPLAVQPARLLSITLPIDPMTRRVAKPNLPVLCAFGDPSYDRSLWSRTQREMLIVPKKDPSDPPDETWLLAADRSDYNADSIVYFAVGRPAPDGGWIAPDSSPKHPIVLGVVRKYGDGTSKNIDIVLASAPREKRDRKSDDGTSITTVFAHHVLESMPHAIELSDLRALEEQGDPPKLVQPPAPSRDRFVLLPGDRLTITSWVGPDNALPLTIELSIIMNPVLSTPPAVYSVICGKHETPDDFSMKALAVPLHASGPMPQTIELPQLREDLARGIVNRRGLFLWRFVATRDVSAAALIKVDRSGGGQLVDTSDDFVNLR